MFNDRENRVTYDPLDFGTEYDFYKAMTELKWLKQINELNESDFEEIANKYKFPKSFLKHGLNGLNYPDDYYMSKSEYYPIIYSWMVNTKKEGIFLRKTLVDYIQYKMRIVFYIVLSLYFLFIFYGFFLFVIPLNINELIIFLVGIFIPFYIPLYLQLFSNLKSKKIIHENQKDKMNGLGMKNEIDSVEKNINDDYWKYSLIGNLLIRKMEEAPYVQAFYLGQANDEIKERIDKNKKHGKKQENVPIFFVENIYFEYFERIKKLNNIDRNN